MKKLARNSIIAAVLLAVAGVVYSASDYIVWPAATGVDVVVKTRPTASTTTEFLRAKSSTGRLQVAPMVASDGTSPVSFPAGITAANGTTSAPSINFTGSTTTGFSRPASNTIDMLLGGTVYGELSLASSVATLSAGSATTGVGMLKAQGASSGFVDAGVVLQAAGATRGTGTYGYNDANDTIWYSGNPYNTPDRFVIQRKSSATAFNADAADSTVATRLMEIAAGGGASFFGSSLAVSSSVNGTMSLGLTNSNTSANAAARLDVSATGGGANADPYFLTYDGTRYWSLGIDHSDSSKLKLSTTTNSGNIGPSGGGATVATFESSGGMTLGGNGGNVPFGCVMRTATTINGGCNSGSVTCGTNEFAVGGGCETASAQPAFLYKSTFRNGGATAGTSSCTEGTAPSNGSVPTGWYCSFGSNSGGVVTISAMCCTK